MAKGNYQHNTLSTVLYCGAGVFRASTKHNPNIVPKNSSGQRNVFHYQFGGFIATEVKTYAIKTFYLSILQITLHTIYYKQ